MNSRVLNLLKLIFISLVILLILVIFLLYKIISSNENFKVINSITKEYNVDNISSINFDFKNVKVIYTNTNSNELVIKQTGKNKSYLVNDYKVNNNLYFKELPSNIFVKTNYKIFIPKKYINKININNGFGNIKIDSFNNKININNNSGNIVIGKIDNSVIKNVSGNINIKKVNKINVESTTGDILIDNITDSANINTITGNIVINKYEINNNSDIETISGNIIIKVDKNSKCLLKIKSNNKNISEKVCLEGINLLSITNEVGEVTIK